MADRDVFDEVRDWALLKKRTQEAWEIFEKEDRGLLLDMLGACDKCGEQAERRLECSSWRRTDGGRLPVPCPDGAHIDLCLDCNDHDIPGPNKFVCDHCGDHFCDTCYKRKYRNSLPNNARRQCAECKEWICGSCQDVDSYTYELKWDVFHCFSCRYLPHLKAERATKTPKSLTEAAAPAPSAAAASPPKTRKRKADDAAAAEELAPVTVPPAASKEEEAKKDEDKNVKIVAAPAKRHASLPRRRLAEVKLEAAPNETNTSWQFRVPWYMHKGGTFIHTHAVSPSGVPFWVQNQPADNHCPSKGPLQTQGRHLAYY